MSDQAYNSGYNSGSIFTPLPSAHDFRDLARLAVFLSDFVRIFQLIFVEEPAECGVRHSKNMWHIIVLAYLQAFKELLNWKIYKARVGVATTRVVTCLCGLERGRGCVTR